MSQPTGRRKPLTVLLVASLALVAMIIWGTTQPTWSPGGPWAADNPMMGGPMMGGQMMGGQMMGGPVAVGDPVTNPSEARRAAELFADQLGLEVGEVMQFDNGYYAELETLAGDPVTEVLIDPDSGSVQVEWGPAMMWNTGYGAYALADSRTPAVTAEQAQSLANEWLSGARNGETAGESEPFPGYYTMHTLRDGNIVGMLSVNATTGAVWYHTWHGRFVQIQDEDEAAPTP
ncbi:MAG: hypothetical protein U0904_07695 [Candidatus Nanopelagicales bacterium]|nr:hypothetical protein [Candidatus Nanopelagicales bacterium]